MSNNPDELIEIPVREISRPIHPLSYANVRFQLSGEPESLQIYQVRLIFAEFEATDLPTGVNLVSRDNEQTLHVTLQGHPIMWLRMSGLNPSWGAMPRMSEAENLAAERVVIAIADNIVARQARQEVERSAALQRWMDL